LHAIIGPNGAGKTTLFNVILGIYRPSEGRVVFDGADIADDPVHDRAKLGISKAYQVNNLFTGLSAVENVKTAIAALELNHYDLIHAIDDQDEVREAALSVLETVGLSDQRDVEAASLPHGDKRRLEIGMALATDPSLLLLDEPTAGLGPDQIESITAVIEELAEDIAVVLVEHDLELVMQISETITVLDQGEIIAQGTPSEVRANETVRDAYMGASKYA